MDFIVHERDVLRLEEYAEKFGCTVEVKQIFDSEDWLRRVRLLGTSEQIDLAKEPMLQKLHSLKKDIKPVPE